jgi:hypothetical protein
MASSCTWAAHVCVLGYGGGVANYRRSHTVPSLTNAEGLAFQRHPSLCVSVCACWGHQVCQTPGESVRVTPH